MKRLVLLAGLAATSAHAQQSAPVERQAPSGGTIRVQSRLVSVALNVIDEHGAPVSGLKQEDFELTEDKHPQTIAYFDRESTTPLAIVIAVDTSESTFAEEHLERDAAKTFVKSLVRPQDSVALMSFADNVTEVVPFTNDPKRVDAGFGRLERGEATAVYDAVYLASQRLAESNKNPAARRVVVMITDGENTTHHGSYDAALEQAQRAGAMIYSLIIVPVEADAGRNTGGEHALMELSKETGGKFYEIINKHDVQPAFEHVSDDLRTQYSIGYYAPQHGGEPSGLRHISLQLKDPALRAKYTLRYRTSYYGPRHAVQSEP